MKIGLIDVDGHNFPNLALMKISAYHKMIGDHVEWATMFEHYNKIYMSKVFTFTPENEYCYSADEVVRGGTGYDVKSKLPEKIDEMFPDYQLYNYSTKKLKKFQNTAIGFLTRGCPNKCSWCIVPLKEGDISPYADIEDITQGMKRAILMDNNVLASPYGLQQLEKIVRIGIRIDFNQGIDARLIDKDVADLLCRVKWIRFIRLACDNQAQIPCIEKAISLLRRDRKQEIFIYMLVNDIKDAHYRAEHLRTLNVDVFAQAFRDFKNKTNPTLEQKMFCRWVNHKATFKSCEWREYAG